MNFLIISHAFHQQQNGKLYSYAPYVREMDLWLKNAERVEIVAPFLAEEPSNIDLSYAHKAIVFNEVPAINFQSIKKILISIYHLPLIVFKLVMACKKADHIHLRCPGNIGLLGCLVQICFPSKIKTAKYAGNWDPNSTQPLSYRFQKWLLSNKFLTKNMTVLVYGNWNDSSGNIKPFFTATFSENEIEEFQERYYSGQLVFMFSGSLVEGKRPLLAVKIIEDLNKKGVTCRLNIYGDGPLRKELESYITEQNLNQTIYLHGNQNKSIIKEALKRSHFVILPSKSEGWPKAIAEGMFFGAIPISTRISCLEWMLDNGKRGVLIEPDVQQASETIYKDISKENLNEISEAAYRWSINYTVEKQAAEIEKIVTQ